MTIIFLTLLALFSDEKWIIQLDDYKIFKDGILAVSDQEIICLTIPLTNEVLFFDPQATLIRRFKRDNDAPNGFRQIVTVGYQAETNLFYIYDFGRKISFWTESGQFKNAVYLKPLLLNPQLPGSHTVIYITNDSGSINSIPSLTALSLKSHIPNTLLTISPLSQINGYQHKSIPGPPVKMPWHHQFLLASGRNFFVASYNKTNEMTIFDSRTLKVVKNVIVDMPSVPLEDDIFKETLKREARLRMFTQNDLIVQGDDIFQPVPLKILLNSGDQIFVYGKNFKGYLRFQYDSSGSLLSKDKVDMIPACMSQSYHYFMESIYSSGYVISRTLNNSAR